MRYAEHNVTDDDVRAVEQVLRSRSLTQGPAVQRFEEALAEYVGARFAVAVSSGTAALHLAVAACARFGWNMLTSPLSFVASANAGQYSDCNVGFADVERETGNLPATAAERCSMRSFGYQNDPADTRMRLGEDMARSFNEPRPPQLCVPVHYAGRAAAIPKGVTVVEDACHALGAWDFDGCSKVGSCAHSLMTCFSFHPSKVITTGEGGAVTTNDEEMARRLRMLRNHGRDDEGRMVALGLNYRMSDMSAALGWSQLRRVDDDIQRRWDIVEWYSEPMADLQGAGLIRRPAPVAKKQHAWHLYPVRIKNGRRDDVRALLTRRGIHCQVHYSPIIPLQPFYAARMNYEAGCFPEAEAWAAEELSLPLYPALTLGDVERVCSIVKEALG